MPLYRVPIYAFAILVCLGAVTYWALRAPGRHRLAALRWFWLAYAACQTALAGFAFYSHFRFPLNLEFMESTGLQHVLRLTAGLPIYVDPAPGFVALAYNPLFYLVCVPFVQLFGPTLSAVRLPAILASVAAAILVGLFVKRQTRSNWWAAVSVGMFAAAYRVMDCYMDVGHRDSFLLVWILIAFFCLDRGTLIPGMLALAVGFWFKQTGAQFLALGICYAFWQYPWRRALIASAAGLALGPVLYTFAPDAWWGPRLHYFTYQVPTQWTELTQAEASNLVRMLIWHYGALLTAAVWLWVRAWRKQGGSLGILRVAIPGALASGAAVMMTPGSNNNVYIPMGTFLIIGGVSAFGRLSRMGVPGRQLAYAMLALAFAPLLYRPQTVITSPAATASYADFTQILRSLDGPVYGPGLGPMSDVPLTPLVHVVPLADMVRGPGRNETANPLVRALLRSVEQPAAPVAYIIAHSLLEDEPTLAYLKSRYRLEADFGRRFEPLATLPARHGHLYPRFLYKSIPAMARGAR